MSFASLRGRLVTSTTHSITGVGWWTSLVEFLYEARVCNYKNRVYLPLA